MRDTKQTQVHHLAILFSALLISLAVACGANSTPPPPTNTPRPPTPTPEPRPSAAQLAVGKAVFIRVGCVQCHKITGISDNAVSAPSLDDAYHLVINALKSPEYKKSQGKAKTPREFIIESIMEPDAFTYPTCPQGPCVKGTMPNNYNVIIRPDELEPLVTFLLWQGR